MSCRSSSSTNHTHISRVRVQEKGVCTLGIDDAIRVSVFPAACLGTLSASSHVNPAHTKFTTMNSRQSGLACSVLYFALPQGESVKHHSLCRLIGGVVRSVCGIAHCHNQVEISYKRWLWYSGKSGKKLPIGCPSNKQWSLSWWRRPLTGFNLTLVTACPW